MEKIPQPIKQVLANSTLYTGKDAIDKLQAMMTEGDSDTPIIVHLASPMQDELRFLVTVRKICLSVGLISSPMFCALESSKPLLIEALMSTRHKHIDRGVGLRKPLASVSLANISASIEAIEIPKPEWHYILITWDELMRIQEANGNG